MWWFNSYGRIDDSKNNILVKLNRSNYISQMISLKKNSLNVLLHLIGVGRKIPAAITSSSVQ